jgi:hypothetical protein
MGCWIGWRATEEGHDFEGTVPDNLKEAPTAAGKSPERDLIGLIKLIVEQADSLFFMNLKGKYEKKLVNVAVSAWPLVPGL